MFVSWHHRKSQRPEAKSILSVYEVLELTEIKESSKDRGNLTSMQDFSGSPESSEEMEYTRVDSGWPSCAPTQGCGIRLLKLLICSPKLVDPRILLLEASMFHLLCMWCRPDLFRIYSTHNMTFLPICTGPSSYVWKSHRSPSKLVKQNIKSRSLLP